MFNFGELNAQERDRTKARYFVDIDYAELASSGGVTSKAFTLFTLQAGDIVDWAFYDLMRNFAVTGASALTMKVGVNFATATDDDDALIEAKSILGGATPIIADAGSIDGSAIDATYGSQELAVLGSLRARRAFAAQEAGALEVVFTSTGANLAAATAGRVRIYFNVIRITELRPISF